MAVAPLAEVPESAAAGATADIYTDIRHAIGVPMVNLVFRHMATVPGCLEWAWAQLAAIYTAGKVADAAASLTAAPALRRPLAMSAAALAEAGLGPGEIAAVVQVCAAYGRANPMNLLGLKVLQLLLSESVVARARRKPLRGQPPRPPAVDLTPLPPMLDLARATPEQSDALRALAMQLHQGDTGVIPSLYRHFGAWPRFLTQLRFAIQAEIDAGRLFAAAEAMERDAHGAARLLYLECPVVRLETPTAETLAALSGLIATFPVNICRMTVVAHGVLAALAPPAPA
ncbi:MAG: hypothetical protein SFV21_19310 [Rhodospirillaceae bacterium]|nr:hypothetical protein [Rhodospirillaceae bacterium]